MNFIECGDKLINLSNHDNESLECAICNKEFIYCEKYVIYDGDPCHLSCALEDQDSVGMDQDFE